MVLLSSRSMRAGRRSRRVEKGGMRDPCRNGDFRCPGGRGPDDPCRPGPGSRAWGGAVAEDPRSTGAHVRGERSFVELRSLDARSGVRSTGERGHSQQQNLLFSANSFVQRAGGVPAGGGSGAIEGGRRGGGRGRQARGRGVPGVFEAGGPRIDRGVRWVSGTEGLEALLAVFEEEVAEDASYWKSIFSFLRRGSALRRAG